MAKRVKRAQRLTRIQLGIYVRCSNCGAENIKIAVRCKDCGKLLW